MTQREEWVRDVRNMILRYQTASTCADDGLTDEMYDLLDRLKNDYAKEDAITKLLKIKSKYDVYRIQSEVNAETLRNLIPMLPQVNFIDITDHEWAKSNAVNKLDAHDVCVLSVFIPNCEFVEDVSKITSNIKYYGEGGLINGINNISIEYNLISNTNNAIKYNVKILGINDAQVESTVLYNQTIESDISDPLYVTYFKNRVMTYQNYVVSSNTSPSTNELGLDTFTRSKIELEYSTLLVYNGKLNIIYSEDDKNEIIGDYKTPTMNKVVIAQEQLILTNVENDGIDLLKFEFYSDMNVAPTIAISYYEDYDDNVNPPDYVEARDNMIKRVETDIDYRVMQMQMSVYNALMTTLQRQAVEVAEDSDDTILATILETTGRIDDVLTRVPTYEPLNFSHAATDDEYAVYQMAGVSVEPDYVSMSTVAGSARPWTDKNVIVFKNNDLSEDFEITCTTKENSMQERTYIKIHDSADVVCYALIEIAKLNRPVKTKGINGSQKAPFFTTPGTSIDKKPLPNKDEFDISVYLEWVDSGSQLCPDFKTNGYTVTIVEVACCFKKLSGPWVSNSASIGLRVGTHNQSISGLYNAYRDGELVTIDYGRLSCVFVAVNETLTVSEDQMPSEYNMYFNFPFKELRSMHLKQNSTGSMSFDHFAIKTGIMVTTDFTVSVRSVSPAVVYANMWEVKVDLNGRHLLDHLVSNAMSVNGTSLDNTNPAFTGTWNEKLKLSDSSVQAGINAMFKHIYLSVDYDVDGVGESPPIDLGIRKNADEYVTALDNALRELSDTVLENAQRLDTVEKQCDYLTRQFEMFLKSQETTFGDFVIEIFMDLAFGAAFAGAGMLLSKLSKMLVKSMGSISRSGSKIMQLSNAFKFLKTDKVSPGDIGLRDTFTNGVLKTIKKDRKDLIPKQASRPLWKAYDNAQHIDLTDKLDLVACVRTAGKVKATDYLEGKDAIKQLAIRNTTGNESLLSEMKIFYRPLSMLGPLSVPVHKLGTGTKGFQRRVRLNELQKSCRYPSHAFAVYDDISRKNGVTTNTRTFFGIGELNKYGSTTGDKGNGIGGVVIKRELRGVTDNGIQLWTYKNFSECGYSETDVYNLYKTLFNKDLTSNAAIGWSEITCQINKKVRSVGEPAYRYIPDSSLNGMLKYMLDNPPKFDYSLLYNNCQSFLLDLVKMMQTGQSPVRWEPRAMLEYQRIRTRNFIDYATTSVISSISFYETILNKGRLVYYVG